MLSQKIFGGDSAEYVTTLVNWGISHPPGYPLYTFLGNILVRVFSFVNIYSAISLLSFLPTIFSCLLIYKINRLLFKSKTISLFSAIFFFSLLPVWLYSLVPEVFALAVFLITFQFYLLLKLNQDSSLLKKNKINLLYLLFFTLGLSFVHHHLFIFFLPSFFYLIFKTIELKRLVWEKKYHLLIWLLFPLLFYLYLPIVSFLTDNISIEDNTTLSGILKTIIRAPYGTFKAYVWGQENFLNRIFDAFAPLFFIFHDFKPLGFIFILLGFFYLFKTKRIIFNFFFINITFLIFFFFYTNFYLNVDFTVATFERFVIFLYAVIIFPFAGGIIFLEKNLPKILLKYTQKKIILNLARAFFLILIFFLLMQNLIKNYPLIAYVIKTDVFENYGKDILRTPEKESLLILTADNSFFISNHFAQIQQIRKDLAIITLGYLSRKHIREKLAKKYPHLLFSTKDPNDLEEFFLKNHQKGIPIFADRPLTDDFWLPYGLLWKYYPNENDAKIAKTKLLDINLKLWVNGYQVPKIDSQYQNILYLNDVSFQYSQQLMEFIELIYSENKNHQVNRVLSLHFVNFKNDKYFIRRLLYLKLRENECDQYTQLVATFLQKERKTKALDYLLLSQYFKQCKNDHKKSQYFYDKFLKFRKKEDVAVEKL